MTIKILMFGDVIGKIGRRALAQVIPELKEKHKPDLVMANVENLAHGKGITQKTIDEIRQAGVDFCTSGNDVWKKEEAGMVLQGEDSPVIRPANFPAELPGQGYKLLNLGAKKLLVVNLLGRVFIREDVDCPFRAADQILDKFKDEDLAGIIIDFHAEATSEKAAFGWHVDGRVSAVFGTHTHVATVDTKILPGKTAFVNDVGVVGARDSVIGTDKENVIKHFLLQTPVRFEMVESGVVTVNAILCEIDASTREAVSIERVDCEVEA